MGLRQSRRGISVRDVLGFYKCGHYSHLEISSNISTTGSSPFHHAPFFSGNRRILARPRRSIFNFIVDVCRARCLFERVDHLLGRDRLVRCARRIHLAAVGVVGRGACTRSTAKQMEIPLAGAVCLPAHHRRFSLHGFDVAALDRMAVDQIVSSNA